MKQLFFILLAMLTLFATANVEGWYSYSIAGIAGQTPARWMQSYEITWRTVTIDTAIEVP